MSPLPGFLQPENQPQGSTLDTTPSGDRINLLSVQPTTKRTDVPCDAAQGKAQAQLKKNVSDRHDIFISAEPGPGSTGCVYKYKFLWSEDLGVQLETPSTAAGLKQADAVLSQREAAKQKELATTYGIVFGAPGEKIRDSDAVRNKKVVPGHPVIASRMPLSELLGIEAALKHSSPDLTLEAGSKPIKFSSSNKNQPENSSVEAEYVPPHDKQQPKITAFPKTELEPITSESSRYRFAVRQKLEATWKALDPAKYKPPAEILNHFALSSIQQIVEHELSHHAEHRIGWPDPTKSDKFAEAMGWIPDPLLSSAEDHRYILRGKHGEYYRRTNLPTLDGKLDWMGVDSKGMAIFSDNGKKLTFYSGEQVAEQAEVKPSSDYFDSPLEMMAESMSRFRDGAQTRRELLEKSPSLYFESKREDQLDINLTYGVNKLGDPNYIRDLDGQLIPTQPETLKTIAMFEERVQKAQK
jgi:hypothetical protein